MRRLALISALLAGCSPVPVGIVDTGSATPSLEATIGVPVGLLCDLVSAEDVASIVRQPVSIDVRSSSTGVCTYMVAPSPGGPQYVLAIRVEDVFEDVTAVAAAFPVGRPIPAIGDAAYWSEDVSTLWFEHEDVLWVVQLVAVTSPPEDAFHLAEATALHLVTELSRIP